MREMTRVLAPGGHLVATVAALDFLHGDHSVLSEEVRRYSRRHVLDLLESAGLEAVRVTYAFATLLPLVLAVRTAQKLWRGHTVAGEREITVPPAPVNAALSFVLSLEAALARYVPLPFGSSLVLLARKRA